MMSVQAEPEDPLLLSSRISAFLPHYITGNTSRHRALGVLFLKHMTNVTIHLSQNRYNGCGRHRGIALQRFGDVDLAEQYIGMAYYWHLWYNDCNNK